MKLHPLTAKQRAAWWAMDGHRMVICDGAVRSGKSVGADHAWVDFALHGPAGNLLMVGKTERTLRRNIIDPLIDMFGARFCRLIAGTGDFYIGNRRTYLVGANDERAQEKIRGVTLVGAYVDEASTVPESFWTMLRSRLSAEGARMIATTNPDAPLHWLKKDWLDKAEQLDIARFTFAIDDNPYLPAEYVAGIKREFTGLWRKRFIEGLWVAAEGAIYDMLDVDAGGRHVVAQLPEIHRWELWIDYGTHNPFHAVLAGYADEALYLCREWRWDSVASHRQLTDAEYSQRLGAWLAAGADGAYEGPVPLAATIIDPSATSFRAQWQRDGWGWALKADNDVLDGIRDVATLLGANLLRIHESCRYTISEHSGYVWDPKAQERGLDAPLKADDHAPDAVRYGVRTGRRRWRAWLANRMQEAA